MFTAGAARGQQREHTVKVEVLVQGGIVSGALAGGAEVQGSARVLGIHAEAGVAPHHARQYRVPAVPLRRSDDMVRWVGRGM
jgi:hypothetical protein